MSKTLIYSAGLAAVGLGLWWLHDKLKKRKAQKVLELPVIDFNIFFDKEKDPERYKKECRKVADAFHKYGVCIVKDPRVNETHNDKFLDMMERYFEGSDGKRDARPESAYQVGVTPSFIERPRDHCSRMGSLGPDNKPLSVCPPELDPKWRFFWRVGERPAKTNYPDLNAAPVIPEEIPEWPQVMDSWGFLLINAVTTLSEMCAVGFDLSPDEFTKRLKFGPHLLAPTGSNFNEFNALNTVLAGYHYDLNFLTIHGKSRYPGLNIWTREGERVGVKVPDGCLFVQAGKQIEYLTGGHILAGFHEVIVAQSTIDTMEKKKELGESLWRVSSTLFSHAASDQILEPLAHFSNSDTKALFPPITAGEQVKQELMAISLDRRHLDK